jgi:hypothetical protein
MSNDIEHRAHFGLSIKQKITLWNGYEVTPEEFINMHSFTMFKNPFESPPEEHGVLRFRCVEDFEDKKMPIISTHFPLNIYTP